MSPEPVEDLQLRAIEQRNRLHQATAELKEKIAETRQELDPRRNVQEHFVGLAAGVGAIAALAGFGIAGMFTRR